MTTLTTERLEEVLAALPPTADETAALFEELGITGRPSCAGECPMAHYLAAEFGITTGNFGAARTGVPGATFYMMASVRDESDLHVMVKSPEHLFQFARSFDDRHYPALVAE